MSNATFSGAKKKTKTIFGLNLPWSELDILTLIISINSSSKVENTGIFLIVRMIVIVFIASRQMALSTTRRVRKLQYSTPARSSVASPKKKRVVETAAKADDDEKDLPRETSRKIRKMREERAISYAPPFLFRSRASRFSNF
jgi:hypothetical protein